VLQGASNIAVETIQLGTNTAITNWSEISGGGTIVGATIVASNLNSVTTNGAHLNITWNTNDAGGGTPVDLSTWADYPALSPVKWPSLVYCTAVSNMPVELYGFVGGTISNIAYFASGWNNTDSVESTNVYGFDGTSWFAVDGIPEARLYAASAVMSNKLYVIGGWASGGFKTNVYEFNGTTWTEVEGLPGARARISAGCVSNKIWAAGGDNPNGTFYTNTYEFDGTAWTEVAGLPLACGYMASAVLSNKMYVAGGCAAGWTRLTNAYSFDGTAWTAINGLVVGINSAIGVSTSNRLFIAGGEDGSYPRSEVYEFNGLSWAAAPELPVGKTAFTGAAISNKVYFAGGSSSGGSVYELNTDLAAYVNYTITATNTDTLQIKRGGTTILHSDGNTITFDKPVYGDGRNLATAADTNVFQPYTADLLVVEGTATVVYASGNLVKLVLTTNVMIAFDNTDYPTNGISKVAMEIWADTNSVTFDTNMIDSTSITNIFTNDWTSLFFRRSGSSLWKGRQ